MGNLSKHLQCISREGCNTPVTCQESGCCQRLNRASDQRTRAPVADQASAPRAGSAVAAGGSFTSNEQSSEEQRKQAFLAFLASMDARDLSVGVPALAYELNLEKTLPDMMPIFQPRGRRTLIVPKDRLKEIVRSLMEAGAYVRIEPRYGAPSVETQESNS